MKIYSILILNKNNMDSFSRYQSLFLDAIQEGKVGICQWDEDGTTADTALPDLHQLTDDKERWQAIIVREDDGEGYYGLNSDAKNPYDFFPEGTEKEGDWDESLNPLIRLTHILGGAPPVEKEFEKKEVKKPHLKPFVVFEPKDDAEKNASYKAFREKYEFDGVMPSSILLVTMRLTHKFEDEAEITPVDEDDMKSSQFWKRNRYPSTCRFIVYDYTQSGPVQRIADEFQFWMLIRIMTSGRIDPAFLQAYRLYRGSIDIDKRNLTMTLRETSNRINSIKQGLTLAVQKTAQGREFFDGEMPTLTYPTPVVVTTSTKADCEVKTGSFGWFSRGASPEITIWDNGKDRAESKVLRDVKLADRALNRAAGKTKEINTFSDDEVERLDTYQQEDLEAETDALYEKIITMQGMLPTGKSVLDEDVNSSSNKVKRFLQERVGFTPVLYTVVFILLLVVLNCIPAFIRAYRGNEIAWKYVCLGSLVIIAAAIVCCGATILLQKLELNQLIRSFNNKINIALSRITSNTEVYGDYLNAVVAHSRGKSYLEKSKKKGMVDESVQQMRYRHLDAANLFLARMEQWAQAFHLDVDFTRPGHKRDIDLDIEIQPAKNAAYSIHSDKNYPIEVNSSGMTVDAPFAFVQRISLDREELYENDGQ